MSVTPLQGSNVAIVTGGSAVVAIPANPNGGYITNPYLNTDQGIGGAAEPLYIDPVGTPGAVAGDGNTTTTVLYPGQTYTVIPGQTTVTKANAATTGHKFTAVYW